MTRLNILVGPPANRNDDEGFVEAFLSSDGYHIVCGGSSAMMVARCLGLEIDLPLYGNFDENTLPWGMIGNDIYVTEGIVTLRNVADAFMSGTVPTSETGELLVYDKLIECNEVNIFWGCAVNSRHPSEIDFSKKEEIISYLINKLQTLDKKVNLYKS